MTRPTAHPVAGSFRVFLVTVVTVFTLALLVAGLRSYRDLSVQRARERLLEQRIADSEERIRGLERTIHLLNSDPGTLEQVAREDLGMAMPGDVILKLSPSVDAPPEAPDSRSGLADESTEVR